MNTHLIIPQIQNRTIAIEANISHISGMQSNMNHNKKVIIDSINNTVL
jgi:hypothetical protein